MPSPGLPAQQLHFDCDSRETGCPQVPAAKFQRRWKRLTRRWSARAVTGLARAVASNPRLGGLALRVLVDRQLAPGVLCRVPFGDHTFYVDPRDDKIGLRLLSGRAWQRRELETAIATLRREGAIRSGGVFVDVGANIGTQTVYAMLSGAFARAVAIEPDPHNFGILQRNLTANGLGSRVEAVAVAASAAPGRLRLLRHPKNFGAHSVESGFVATPTEAVEVPAVGLDELIKKLGIPTEDVTLVKIDVEGHESAVLAGMPVLRRAGVPVIVELTTDRAQRQRLAEFKSMFDLPYRYMLDLAHESEPAPVANLGWQAPQSDLLIY
jgi:FkbM family methyltransferase